MERSVATISKVQPGSFAFSVGPGRYRLGAYEDRNRNRHLDPGERMQAMRAGTPAGASNLADLDKRIADYQAQVSRYEKEKNEVKAQRVSPFILFAITSSTPALLTRSRHSELMSSSTTRYCTASSGQRWARL